MKKIIAACVLITAILAAGCVSSRITTFWKAPGTVPGRFNKIMVVGIMRKQDRVLREKMEAHLAGDLRALGYNAISSLQQFGPRDLDVTNEEQMNERLRADSVDAVLTIVLLDKEKERYYEPGRTTYTPYGIYSNHFAGYYRTLNARISMPGYYTTVTRYFWESNFYNLHTNELLYSVQTQSFDPGSAEILGHEYGKMIVQHMVKNNVLSNYANVRTAM